MVPAQPERTAVLVAAGSVLVSCLEPLPSSPSPVPWAWGTHCAKAVL